MPRPLHEKPPVTPPFNIFAGIVHGVANALGREPRPESHLGNSPSDGVPGSAEASLEGAPTQEETTSEK